MGRKKDTQRPSVAILVDCSRDFHTARELAALEPDDCYVATRNHEPLRAALLRRYDVLAIAGHGLATYSPAELRAIERFVRGGGGLLLAASAGTFERFAHRPVAQMAVAAIARRFGIEFLSPSEARGRPARSLDGVAGYPQHSLRIHQGTAMRGVHRSDAWLRHWSPLRAGKPAEVLLSHRRTAEAAALLVPFGKGRVLAAADTGFLPRYEHSPWLCRRWIDVLAGAASERPRPARLPREIHPTWHTRRGEGFELQFASTVAARVPAVLRIARKTVPMIRSITRPKEGSKLRVRLVPGCTSTVHWEEGTWEMMASLGAEAPDCELAFAIGSLATRRPLGYTVLDQATYWSVLGGQGLGRYAGLLAMRRSGFEHEATALAAELARESRRRLSGTDLAWYYPEGAEGPGLWLWQELERLHGPGLLERFAKALPKKAKWDPAPRAVYTPLDIAIHFLSRAAKTDLYPWFAEFGATVHPLPAERFGSKAFKHDVKRRLRHQLADGHSTASERADALDALLDLEKQAKRPLKAATRQARSVDPCTRLLGAARLARARDPRALDALRALADSDADPALAALAARSRVDFGRRAAAERLAELAERLDPRFQLEAAHLLARVGHPAAERFSLEGIRHARGRDVARIEVDHGIQQCVYPVVNGQRVGNIFSAEGIGHMPGNTHVSRLSVYWVHTSPKYRRRGLARVAMERTFAEARARRCSCATLGTGTRNFAHALYRSFGFVDEHVGEELSRALERDEPAAPAKGLRIRRYRPGDEAAMSRLYDACYGDGFEVERRWPARITQTESCLLAWRGRKLAAYVQASVTGKEAALCELPVAAGKKREETVRALLTRLHTRLRKKGVRTVQVYSGVEMLAPLLQPLGYRASKNGDVGMFALIHLPQFLREIAPLVERRMAKKDWTGTIALLGEKHRAGLALRRGRVRVLRDPPEHPDITLEGTDVAITQVVGGIHTVYEPYLQLQLRIAPPLNARTLDLLETLFPRVPRHW